MGNDSRTSELDGLVTLLPVKDRRLEAMRRLVGGVTATELRSCRVDAATFAALTRGLGHANPRVRWWCIQLLDHLEDPRALEVIAPLLDDPVPRVRRMAAHALTCQRCKPGARLGEAPRITAKLSQLAATDPNAKVRAEAWWGLGTCRT